MHGDLFRGGGRFGRGRLAGHFDERGLRAVVVGVAAAGCVDPADPGEVEHLAHPVEEVVFEFAERLVGMGLALLGQQVGRGLRPGPEGQRLGDVIGEILEIVAVRDRGALALELDHRADTLRGIGVDGKPAGRHLAVGPHRLGLDPLLAQPLHGLLRVAAAFLERLLALHHREARLVAEGHHCRCCNLCHGSRSERASDFGGLGDGALGCRPRLGPGLA